MDYSEFFGDQGEPVRDFDYYAMTQLRSWLLEVLVRGEGECALEISLTLHRECCH